MNSLIDTREIELAFNDLINELENIKDLNEQVDKASKSSEAYFHSSENYRKGTEELSSQVQNFYGKYKEIDDELRYLLEQNSTILDNFSLFLNDLKQKLPENSKTEIANLRNTIDNNKLYFEQLLNMNAISSKGLIDKLRRDVSDNQNKNHSVFSDISKNTEIAKQDTTRIFEQINKTIQLNTSLSKQIEDNYNTISDALREIAELKTTIELSITEQTTQYNNVISQIETSYKKQTDSFNEALQEIHKKIDSQAQNSNKAQNVNLALNLVIIIIGAVLILLGFNIF